jgi:hypothetical protein
MFLSPQNEIKMQQDADGYHLTPLKPLTVIKVIANIWLICILYF